MIQIKNPQLEKIIEQLATMLDLCYVFESQLKSGNSVRPLIIVLHQGDQTTIAETKALKLESIFKTLPWYTFKIFTNQYALTSLKEHHLFFLQHCVEENNIYSAIDATFEAFKVPINWTSFDLIREQTDEQFNSCIHYFYAAVEYKEDGLLDKALSSIYSYHKCLMDIAAKLYLGERFENISIKELQSKMASFDIKLGSIYNLNHKEDYRLLQLLDQVAEHGYFTLTPENDKQVEALIAKASKTLDATKELLRNQLEATKISFKNLGKLKQLPPQNSSKEYQKIREEVQKLVNRKIKELRPGHEKTYYKASLKIDGPADILYHISSVLKVCIIALGNENSNQFPNPNLNIQTTLEHILQLLPFEEIECLEKIIKELDITTDHYVLEPINIYSPRDNPCLN